MYLFLTTNNFMDHNIQKGFTPNLSGTAQMANIINKARSKQRSLLSVKFIISSYPYLIITTSLNILTRSLKAYILILKHQ